MPTVVQFAGGESVTVSQDFETVNGQLGQKDSGLFNRLVGDEEPRVTVYRANVPYIEEAPEGSGVPFVAAV